MKYFALSLLCLSLVVLSACKSGPQPIRGAEIPGAKQGTLQSNTFRFKIDENVAKPHNVEALSAYIKKDLESDNVYFVIKLTTQGEAYLFNMEPFLNLYTDDEGKIPLNTESSKFAKTLFEVEDDKVYIVAHVPFDIYPQYLKLIEKTEKLSIELHFATFVLSGSTDDDEDDFDDFQDFIEDHLL